MPSSSVVSSKSSLVGGIFTAEPGQRLLAISDLLAKRGFEGLYEKCASNVGGNYYQTGLRRVHMWSDDVINEDIAYVRGRCPDLDETYEACFVHYIAERFTGRQRPTIHCPPLATFVRRFLESIAQQDSLITGDFFSQKDPLVRRITCMDATRSALYALVTAESLRIELASEVSHARSNTRTLSEVAPPSQTTPHSVPSAYRRTAAEDATTEVRPEDSVSQVESVRSSRVARPRPPPASAADDPRQRPLSPPARTHERTPDPPVSSLPRPASPPSRRGDEDDEDDARSMTVISTRSARERRDEAAVASSSHRGYDAPPSTRHRPTEEEQEAEERPVRRQADEEEVTQARHPPQQHPAHRSRDAPRSRHDFTIPSPEEEEEEEEATAHRSRSPRESVASLRTRSVVAGSASSSVSIGMKRLKSPRN